MAGSTWEVWVWPRRLCRRATAASGAVALTASRARLAPPVGSAPGAVRVRAAGHSVNSRARQMLTGPDGTAYLLLHARFGAADVTRQMWLAPLRWTAVGLPTAEAGA